MTIHLISFASLLHKQVSLRSSHEAILSELEKYYTVKLVDYQDMDKLTSDDFKIIFIATGCRMCTGRKRGAACIGATSSSGITSAVRRTTRFLPKIRCFRRCI